MTKGNIGIRTMGLTNHYINNYVQQNNYYGATPTLTPYRRSVSPSNFNVYPSKGNQISTAEMKTLFGLMLEVIKMFQQAKSSPLQTQACFKPSWGEYEQKYLFENTFQPQKTFKPAQNTALMVAMLLGQKSHVKLAEVTPSVACDLPVLPELVPPNPLPKIVKEKTDELPVYTPPAPNKKVYIVGSYDQKKWLSGSQEGATLGDTIQNFSGIDTNAGWGISQAVWHNDDKTNDEDLMRLFNKMSAEDKKISFKDNEAAYVIDEDGKILAKIGASQIVDKASLSTCQPSPDFKVGGSGANMNTTFSIIEDLGVDKTKGYHDYSMYYASTGVHNNKGISNLEEAKGGKIKLNGQEFDVITTVIRKDTPLTFDLNGDGVKTSDKMIKYDIDGDGTLDTINDVADGTLTIRGGASGHDVFGNNTDLDGDGKADGFKDGFEALKALARKEGLIDGKQDMVLDAHDLALLEKKYQLAMKTAGYLSKNESLKDLGITEIRLGRSNETKTAKNFDGLGNDLMSQEGSTFKINGKTQDYADVWHLLK